MPTLPDVNGIDVTFAHLPSRPDTDALGCHRVAASKTAASCVFASDARSGCRVGFLFRSALQIFFQILLQVRVSCNCGCPAWRVFEWQLHISKTTLALAMEMALVQPMAPRCDPSAVHRFLGLVDMTSPQWGSNPRPYAYEAHALPTEL
jgi:hypothetical protein